MDTITEIAYTSGYRAGKSATAKRIFSDIDSIMDSCTRDNGEIIIRALTKLKDKYEKEMFYEI